VTEMTSETDSGQTAGSVRVSHVVSPGWVDQSSMMIMKHYHHDDDLLLGHLELRTILVSPPVKTTMPRTQCVLRRDDPRSRKLSCGETKADSY
jgi:hypothetical protein